MNIPRWDKIILNFTNSIYGIVVGWPVQYWPLHTVLLLNKDQKLSGTKELVFGYGWFCSSHFRSTTKLPSVDSLFWGRIKKKDLLADQLNRNDYMKRQVNQRANELYVLPSILGVSKKKAGGWGRAGNN